MGIHTWSSRRLLCGGWIMHLCMTWRGPLSERVANKEVQNYLWRRYMLGKKSSLCRSVAPSLNLTLWYSLNFLKIFAKLVLCYMCFEGHKLVYLVLPHCWAFFCWLCSLHTYGFICIIILQVQLSMQSVWLELPCTLTWIHVRWCGAFLQVAKLWCFLDGHGCIEFTLDSWRLEQRDAWLWLGLIKSENWSPSYI